MAMNCTFFNNFFKLLFSIVTANIILGINEHLYRKKMNCFTKFNVRVKRMRFAFKAKKRLQTLFRYSFLFAKLSWRYSGRKISGLNWSDLVSYHLLSQMTKRFFQLWLCAVRDCAESRWAMSGTITLWIRNSSFFVIGRLDGY